PPPSQTKLTSTLHLLIPRLRLLQKKDTASSVIQRRDLSALLSEGRDNSARIRVENVIATDIAVEVMEMVELYCELLLARANVLDQAAFGEKGTRARSRARGLVVEQSRGSSHSNQGGSSSGGGGGFSFWGWRKSTSQPSQSQSQSQQQQQQQQQQQPPPPPPPPETKPPSSSPLDESDDSSSEKEGYIDPPLDEAAAVIFYSYTRFPHDIREMTILRGLLSDRWGKDFMILAQDNKLEDVRVPERLVRSLRVRPPSAELVESYLGEIARSYRGGVPGGFERDTGYGDHGDHGDHGDEGGGEGVPVTPRKGPTGVEGEARRASETVELSKATPPRGLYEAGKSPVSVAPPGPRTDNLHPRVKVSGEDLPREKQKTGKSEIPELDELTRRFAALRR
ncbi:DUF292-domain-containing protein, partial [Aspergillus ellipticus CBS 707.79]